MELKEDSNFEIVNILGKNAEYAYGKYTIYDNNITLIPKDEKSYFFNNKAIEGKVEGSKITFSNFFSSKNCIFNKK